MRIKEAISTLARVMEYNDELADRNAPASRYIVPMLRSSPGTGKTSIVYQASAQTGRECQATVLTTVESADVGGFPYPIDQKMADGTMVKYMRRSRPWFIPYDGNLTLFLDEISKCAPSVQNTISQLLEERRVMEHKLAPHSTVVLAANQQQDRSGDMPMPRHLLNRVTIIPIELPYADWLEWASTSQIDPSVCAYISFKGDKGLNNFDAKAEVNATPRTWEKASNVRALKLPRRLETQMIAGYIGEGPAADFAGFLKMVDDVPHPDTIIDNPQRAPVPKEKQMIYALMTALIGHAAPKTIGPIVEYLERIPEKEYAVFAMMDIIHRQPKLNSAQAVRDWKANNRHLFAPTA